MAAKNYSPRGIRMSNPTKILSRIYEEDNPAISDILYFLKTKETEEISLLFSFADRVRKQHIGDGIYLRGLIEFSNYCRNTCFYCGLQKRNTNITRYRMSEDEILECINDVYSSGIKTVVLQSGEDDNLDSPWISNLIRKIKRQYDIIVTLSLGEWPKDHYSFWKEAGADRYLLKIETTAEKLYDSIHPGMSYENRIECIRNLKSLGYETGSGIIIGLPGQTIETIAEDILFFFRENLDMIGIGPFIPHPYTQLASCIPGDTELTLKVIALIRIITKTTNIPATTALGTLDKDKRKDALDCGANVLMPIFTPVKYKNLYEIYPDRICNEESGNQYRDILENLAISSGRYIDSGKGNRCMISNKL